MTDVAPREALQAVLTAGAAPESCGEGGSARAYRSGHTALHAKTPMPAAASTPWRGSRPCWRRLTHLDLHVTREEVRFLHTWHHVVRLLWVLDHDHVPGQERWRYHLSRWLG